MNGSLSARPVKLELSCVDLQSTWTHKETHDVVLLPNQSTELLSIQCPSPSKDGLVPPTGYAEWTTSASVVVGTRLLDAQTGEVLARFADWPQPYRYLDLPNPGLKVSVDQAAGTVSVEVQKPAKCVVLAAKGDGQEVKWSDNALDLMPGDKRELIVTGLDGRDLQVSYLGKEKASPL